MMTTMTNAFIVRYHLIYDTFARNPFSVFKFCGSKIVMLAFDYAFKYSTRWKQLIRSCSCSQVILI